MTSSYQGWCEFDVDPDYNIWIPALRPAIFERGDLDLEAWALKMTGSCWAVGTTPNPNEFEVVRRLLTLTGNQDFPASVPWENKWIHFPDRTDMPLAVMISESPTADDGSDEELRAYLRVGDPVLLEEPIVEEVHTPLGRGLRALAYSPLHEQGKINICATLSYAWRVHRPGTNASIVRLYTMQDPTHVLKATDDIHALVMTLRLADNDSLSDND